MYQDTIYKRCLKPKSINQLLPKETKEEEDRRKRRERVMLNLDCRIQEFQENLFPYKQKFNELIQERINHIGAFDGDFHKKPFRELLTDDAFAFRASLKNSFKIVYDNPMSRESLPYIDLFNDLWYVIGFDLFEFLAFYWKHNPRHSEISMEEVLASRLGTRKQS